MLTVERQKIGSVVPPPVLWPKVSFGNKKLPPSTLIFNLPAVETCPGKTEFCRTKCYALKAQRQYKATRAARAHNLALVRVGGFGDKMADTIAKNLRKIKQVRIHESGDFFSQQYLDEWLGVVRRFPSLPFWAYTKSFHLDFSQKPANLFLIGSFDKTTKDVWRGLYEKQKSVFNSTFIVVEKDANATCIQDCSKCNICWTKSGQQTTVNVH